MSTGSRSVTLCVGGEYGNERGWLGRGEERSGAERSIMIQEQHTHSPTQICCEG